MSDGASIWLIDSTLRDGEQAPGVAFRDKEKIRLAHMLDEAGIDEIEAGTPAMGDAECVIIRRIAHLRLGARVSVWCRALIRDVELAALTDADGIHIAFPVSDAQLSALGKSRAWLNDALPETVSVAAQFFAHVSVGAQDAGRTETERLREFVDLAVANAVSRVRIADTVGILTPLRTVNMIEDVRKRYPALQIDFHAHNDLGMATANAITAWDMGATALSATVNGLGERSGNAALDELLMILTQVCGVTKYSVGNLYALCRYVADISGRPLPDMKPVCGKWACSHESGIHVRGTVVDTTAFQAFDGAVVGRESHEICFGKHSGRVAVIDLLRRNNIDANAENVNPILCRIREIAQRRKRALSADEVLSLCIMTNTFEIADTRATNNCHCEECSDEAIHENKKSQIDTVRNIIR